jgi:solute carrier family 30 (zinc transporter), member 5/7
MSASASPTKGKDAASGSHSHGENMQGIYLHIMADALGSVSVVVSTLLIKLTGWSGWDPIASCLIAVLIFASTCPLVSSTTRILLLSLNSDIEYNLRDILAGVSGLRGVASCSVPKFWLEDIKKDVDHHGHSHGHSHGGHSHERKKSDVGHDHEHDHSAEKAESTTVLGVMHVMATMSADLYDVESRVSAFLKARKMDVVVQVEREGDSRCWCGGAPANSSRKLS